MSKQFTANDVKEHAGVDKGLYIIIDSNVYEMGGFVDEHPGGAKILKRVGGKDASKQFWKVSRSLCPLLGLVYRSGDGKMGWDGERGYNAWQDVPWIMS